MPINYQLPLGTLPVVRNSLDEQVGADVEECCQLFGLRFANGALAVEYLGRNSFRSEDFPQVLLHQIAGLHQMVKCLLRTGLRNGMAAFLIILNQYRQEFGQLLFFAGSVIAFVKTQKLAGQPFTFLIRPDDR